MDLEDPGTATVPLGLFCGRLKRLQAASGISQAGLLSAVDLKRSQLSDILNGKIKRPPDWDVTIAIVRGCLKHAKAVGSLLPPDLSDEADWQRRYFDLEQDLDSGPGARPRREEPTGRALAEVTDPFALEVHRPVQPDAPQPGLPALTAYVAREHDGELERVVAAAAQGCSGIAVLVGGSSTGKTRACWEALRLLRERPERWRLWHPIDPARPEGALRELSAVGPRTVVWLNEAQFYLGTADGLGERVAAGLRGALRDPARAPVLVLATLWPEHWASLTARPAASADDPHAQARELLAGRDITVPAAFTVGQLGQAAAARDPRLALAAGAAEDGQVIQFLAGAPELTARYRNAPPAAAALIDAAIDARRLGMGIGLPLAFLEAAAPGYLTDTQWDGLGEDWLEQALAYTAAPCKGIRGPLARIRPRPADSADPVGGPACRLADYLEQHGRRTRRVVIPPVGFWEAAARFAAPSDLPALAETAGNRGLLRDAARLSKHATGHGNATEAATLIRHWHFSLGPQAADPSPAQWAAVHATLDDPGGVAVLLDALQEAGAEDQVAMLLARDPATHVSFDNLGGVARLLEALRQAVAEKQAGMLARRAATYAALDDPGGVAVLLDALREAGAEDRVAVLLARDPATHVSFDNPGGAGILLHALRRAGAKEQADVLARRAATYAALDNPEGVARLVRILRSAGAEDQVAVLLARDPATRTLLDSPYDLAWLLDVLQEVGAREQVAALARRAASHVSLDNMIGSLDYWGDLGRLLHALRDAGEEEQAIALARRAASHVSLDNLGNAAWLVDVLQEVGAGEQVAALARRAASHVSLDNPEGVARLVRILRRAGAEDQVAVLLARDPAANTLLDDSSGVASLLRALQEVGAGEQVAALARRAASHVSLDNKRGVSRLLTSLRDLGAYEQVKTLLDRLPAEGQFFLFRKLRGYQVLYQFGREPDGSPAPSWGWDDLD